MSSTPASASSHTNAPQGTLVDAFGGRYYRISDVNHLPTFFMNVVSSSDLWLFVASNGGLTAGRSDSDQALIPYQTVDRIYDSAGVNGPITALWVSTSHGPVLWRPFDAQAPAQASLTRNLYKSIEGDRVWFEEINSDLGLVFRYGWSSAENQGLVRRCELINTGAHSRSIRLLDGLRNLLPPGVPLRLQSGSSCLADAYKSAELVSGTSLAIYALAAGIVDRAIALESLRASIAWSDGLPSATILLSDAQLGAFLAGRAVTAEPQKRGLRCSYLLETSLNLAAGETTHWTIGADIGLSQSAVAARCALARQTRLAAAALADAESTSLKLRQLVASADGCQHGADEIVTAHHFTNVLFNIMRGGVFASGDEVITRDFASVAAQRNRTAAQRHAALLAQLPPTLPRRDFLARIATAGDADLSRLAEEYLPVTFSRRHGDPSRPWNRFRIRVRDEQGERVLAHEGNWRDIFQNWEALCVSYPDFVEAVIAKFLSASTADGYNPYRITHAGIDWEVPDHEDPWASIGYWGDHQVIYLEKLLEWSGRYHPGRLQAALRTARFAYADVPYRIAGYADLCRQPRDTIQFDNEKHRRIVAREATEGTDARLVHLSSGAVAHANLTEKLLLLALTRMTNFVAGAGIWMNTQRPEWNDANNALVGYGVSTVTLAYLRRLLAHIQTNLWSALGDAPVEISTPLAQLALAVQTSLAAHRDILRATTIAATRRRSLLDALGQAGSAYRATIYAQAPGATTTLKPDELRALFALSLEFVDHSLRAARRSDGLYESYTRLEFTESPAALLVHSLYPMLEGQVAVLSSGVLTPAEATALLRALRTSSLYRADQHSYLLYPDRQLPGFLARNIIPESAAAASPLLTALLAAGDTRLILRDAAGTLRFHADLANDEALQARLKQLAADPKWATQAAAESASIGEIYEGIFHHRAFTGRSGSMFGYEGLGCIYWHMVAKLLLATQENYFAAAANSAPETAALYELYYDVRAGLGFNKTPVNYGAFPTDPYSHTPGHSGAQQPGMTGQVKEEVLTRWGELGVQVEHGRLTFRPSLLRASEFSTAAATISWPQADGTTLALELPADTVAFTYCGVPVVYHRSPGVPRILCNGAHGTQETSGLTLDAETSSAIFHRTGRIARVDVHLGNLAAS